MIESEAKTKWCPFARVLAEMVRKGDDTGPTLATGGSFNRRIPKDASMLVSVPVAAACIGSDCMGWRWMTGDQQARGIGARGDGTPNDERARGFCGLAGQS
jgi:hypothetical protein